MAIEVLGVSDWLYDTITADATLAASVSTRVYDEVAPQGATFPYIIFSYAGGSDSQGVGTTRIFHRGTWIVKVVDQSKSYSTMRSLAKRLDDVLQGNSGVNADTRIYACSRRSVFKQLEVENGVQYRHVGGLYSIVAQGI